MVLCEDPREECIFTLVHMFREKPSEYFAFIGDNLYFEHSKLWKELEKGKKLNKRDRTKLVSEVGAGVMNNWEKKISKGEKVTFIPNRIFLDDTIFQVKLKIFVYLSHPRERKFLIPQRQQLWVTFGKKSHVLGIAFSTQGETVNYPPALDGEVKIDKHFLSAEGERLSTVQVVNQESNILYDMFRELNQGDVKTPKHGYINLYMLDDELRWLAQEGEKETKALWNGYLLKSWPFAQKEKASPAQIVRMYRDAEEQEKAGRQIMDSLMEPLPHKDPQLEPCVAWQLIFRVHAPTTETSDLTPSYRLREIYVFLRQHLSSDMPFLHYKTPKEKMPYISVYEPSILDKKITQRQLRNWIYARGTSIPIASRGIKIKLFLYNGVDGEPKFETITIHSGGDIDVNVAFEEDYGASDKQVLIAVRKVTDLIRFINTEFLSKQKSKLLIVPEMKMEKGEFILSPHMKIRYFNTISLLPTQKEIDFKNLLKFSRRYRFIAEPSLLSSDTEDVRDLILKYRRISAFTNLPTIIDFINRERMAGSSPSDILDAIIRRFGKTRQEATELLKKWVLLREDRQTALRLFRQPGVTIEIKRADVTDNKWKNRSVYKVYFQGLPSIFILRHCYRFIQHMIYAYFHPKIAPEEETTRILQEKGIEFDFGYAQENVIPSQVLSRSKDEDEEEASMGLSDINLSSEENIRGLKRPKIPESTVDLRDESMTDPTVRLRCAGKEGEKIPEKGTCINVCDDPQFKLRRLQQFEPKIFHFRIARHNETYSRKCSEHRRPLVMEINPEKDPNIDKDAFTYAVPYRSAPENPYFYYICPKAWCPICEKPIAVNKIRDRKKVKTKRGDCEYGLCPHGNHQVYINTSATRLGKEYIYPGFQDPSGNPDGLCMPCCFLTPQQKSATFRRCTTEVEGDISEAPEDTVAGNYVYHERKVPLPEGRFGIPPFNVEVFLEQKGCVSGPIKQDTDCFVRRGVPNNPQRSFLLAITDIYSSHLNRPFTENQLRRRLIQKLSPSLFRSLAQGRIYRLFGTIDKFKEYLRNDNDRIDESFLWDLVSRPKILTEKGFNLLVFTPHSIYCPLGELSKEFYRTERPTAMIIKFGMLYEPLYRLKSLGGTIRSTPFHSSVDPAVRKALEFARTGCQWYNEIDWNEAGDLDRMQERDLEETMEELKRAKLGPVTLQLLDSYSKVTAVLLLKGEYLPVKPSAINTKFPFVLPDQSKTGLPVLTLDKTLQFLKKVKSATKLPVIPTKLIVNARDTNIVIGILLETLRVVPVKPIPLAQARKKVKTVSDILYYADLNRLVSQNKEKLSSTAQERIRSLNEYHYKNEIFERFKYEFSRYLQEKAQQKEKTQLIQLLESPDKNHKKISDLVCKIGKRITASASDSKKRIAQVIQNADKLYHPPLYRRACFSLSKKDCDQDPHCVCVGKSCKLASIPGMEIEKRLIDLLKRYPVIREDILDGTVPSIDPAQQLIRSEVGEVLLTGNKLDTQFERLFAKERDAIVLESFPDVDISQPTFEGIDKQRFLKFSHEKQAEVQTYSVAALSTQWAHALGPWYRMVSPMAPCDSLFFAFAQIAAVIAKQKKDISDNQAFEEEIEDIQEEEVAKRPDPGKITVATIREIYGHYLLQIKPPQMQTIAESLGKIPVTTEERGLMDVSDFYNHLQDREHVDSVDDLARRIIRANPPYRPTIFDVIFLASMMDIHIILLRKATSELIGKGFINSEMYGVLFYEPTMQEEECTRFYLVQQGGKALVSKSDATIRKLLPA
jgi:hypothetical protein